MTEPKSGGEINAKKREMGIAFKMKLSLSEFEVLVNLNPKKLSNIRIELSGNDFLLPNDLFYLLKVILSFIYESIDVELN